MPVTDAPKRDILSDNNPPPHPMSKHLSLFNEYILSNIQLSNINYLNRIKKDINLFEKDILFIFNLLLNENLNEFSEINQKNCKGLISICLGLINQIYNLSN